MAELLKPRRQRERSLRRFGRADSLDVRARSRLEQWE